MFRVLFRTRPIIQSDARQKFFVLTDFMQWNMFSRHGNEFCVVPVGLVQQSGADQ